MRQLTNIFPFFFFLLKGYILINLIHLSWRIVQPEGFWSFCYFLGVFAGLAIALGLAAYIIVALVITAVNLFADYPESLSRKNLLKLAGLVIGIPLIILFNFFWTNGFSLYLSDKMANKYSYLNKSEKYLSEGAVKDALRLAEKAYNKETGREKSGPFFILTFLYEHTGLGADQEMTAKYGAVINYGYCLMYTGNATKAERLFNDALELSQSTPLVKEPHYKAFPIMTLAQLALDQGRYEEGEGYFNQLLKMTDHLKKQDVEYASMTVDIFSAYEQRTGDTRRAARLNIENLELYEKSDLSKKSSMYLMRMILAAYSYIQLGDLNSAGELITKAQPLAEKKKKKEAYLSFLGLKAVYCNVAAAADQELEKVVAKGWWYKALHVFSPKKTLKERYLSESESCLKELTERTRSRYGDTNPAYSRSLVSLATFHWSQSNFREAQKLYGQALKTLEPYKDQHVDYYNNVLLRSCLTRLFGNKDKMVAAELSRIEDFFLQDLTASYLFFTEEEKETYISRLEKNMGAINSAYITINTPQSRMKLFDNILAIKNVALFSTQHFRTSMAGAADSLKGKYVRLLKQKEASRMLEGYSSIDPDQMNNEIRLREKDIIRDISAASAFRPFNPRAVKWTDIRAALKEGEAAVEFISVADRPFSAEANLYFALLITKASVAPELIPLFKEEDLMKVLNKGGEFKRKDRLHIQG